jgi:hypothetical protein
VCVSVWHPRAVKKSRPTRLRYLLARYLVRCPKRNPGDMTLRDTEKLRTLMCEFCWFVCLFSDRSLFVYFSKKKRERQKEIWSLTCGVHVRGTQPHQTTQSSLLTRNTAVASLVQPECRPGERAARAQAPCVLIASLMSVGCVLCRWVSCPLRHALCSCVCTQKTHRRVWLLFVYCPRRCLGRDAWQGANQRDRCHRSPHARAHRAPRPPHTHTALRAHSTAACTRPFDVGRKRRHAPPCSPCNFGQPGRPRDGHVCDGRLDVGRRWGRCRRPVPVPVHLPRSELHRVHHRCPAVFTLVRRRWLGHISARQLGIVRLPCTC